MTNPCAVFFFTCTLVEAQPGYWRKKVGGNKCTAHVRCSVGITPVETFNETKRSAAVMESHTCTHASKCFIHGQMHIMPTGVQNCHGFAKLSFLKAKTSFFFLPFASYSIKDEEISIAMVTHNPLLFYLSRCRYVIPPASLLFIQSNWRKRNDLSIYDQKM